MTEEQTQPQGPTRAGFCAIIGAPNAGKSTLVNRLVGSKVSIVSQKVQTTRFPVRGVAIEGESQIVLLDTPGIFTPRRRLDRAMVRSAWGGAEEADAVVHLVDVQAELAAAEPGAKSADKRSAADVASIIEGLKGAGKTAILALNKIDGVKRERLLALSQRLFDTGVYSEVFMISAADGSGVGDLKDGSVRIEQTIYVERESQRPIVLGKNGQTLKWIGQKSREELTELLDRPVHLFLTVKVDERWADRREFYGDVGLDFEA